jgi:hypothetical protein
VCFSVVDQEESCWGLWLLRRILREWSSLKDVLFIVVLLVVVVVTFNDWCVSTPSQGSPDRFLFVALSLFESCEGEDERERETDHERS